MKRNKRPVGLALALALGLVAAVPAVSQARTLYATTSTGKLVSFADKATKIKAIKTESAKKSAKKAAKAVQVKSTRTIVGLPSGVQLVGIDFRPKTGELFGIGSNSQPFRLLLTEATTAAAYPIGGGFTPGLSGANFGVDFNPVPDAIRIVSDSGMNYRVSPITGTQGMGSPDAALNPAGVQIVGAGYSNSSINNTQPVGMVTTLFTIDAAANTLNTQGSPGGSPTSPNTGTQIPVGPLGVDVGSAVGFDVTGPFAGPAGVLTNVAGGKTTLYSVNLVNGQTAKVGNVVTVNKKGKAKPTNLTGLAAVQD